MIFSCCVFGATINFARFWSKTVVFIWTAAFVLLSVVTPICGNRYYEEKLKFVKNQSQTRSACYFCQIRREVSYSHREIIVSPLILLFVALDYSCSVFVHPLKKRTSFVFFPFASRAGRICLLKTYLDKISFIDAHSYCSCWYDGVIQFNSQPIHVCPP